MRTMLRLTGKSESFDFEISTAAYQKYVATRGSRWPEQERLGRSPALQHVGLATAETTLEGVIYPGMARKAGGSIKEGLRKLRRLSLSTEPFQLVTGTGDVCGFWAVTEVNDTRSYFLDDGQARKAEFSIKLRFYGTDYGSGGGGGVIMLPNAAASAGGIVWSSSDFGALPTIHETSTLAEITAVTHAAGGLIRGAVSLAADVLRYIHNPLDALGMALGLGLPQEAAGGIRAVTQAAREIVAVGDMVFETVSAVTALPYTLSGDGRRVGDMSFTLRQNLLYTRDTARLHNHSMAATQRNLESTGSTFARLPERQTTAEACMHTAHQAERMGTLCRGLDGDCSRLLEKFR